MNRPRLLPLDYAVRSALRGRLKSLLAAVSGFLVVLVLLAAGAFVRGMDVSLVEQGAPQNVILLGSGSEESVERSEIGPATPSMLAASVPGIAEHAGQAAISPEVHVQLTVHLDTRPNTDEQFLVRGVEPAAWIVHPNVWLQNGRLPRPGQDEVLLGVAAMRRLGLTLPEEAIGARLRFAERVWTVSGVFDAGRSVISGEVWMPLNDLRQAMQRTTLSCVVFSLGSDGRFSDVDLFVKSRLDLELMAMPERLYYRSLGNFFAPLKLMAWVTAILMAVGALFGGLNSTHALFAGRVRELGTLLTLGYSRSAVLLSMTAESVLIASCGALLAGVVALTLLDGLAVHFSLGSFGLLVDGRVMLPALGAGLLAGMLGVAGPAMRCFRLPISQALRA